MRLDQINLFDPVTQEDWYPAYDVLRTEAPVFMIRGAGMAVLTRYEDIAMVVRRSDIYSNQPFKHGGANLLKHKEAWDIYEREGWPRSFPLSTDPPEHKDYRALVDHFFKGEGLERVRALITSTVDGLIDQFIDQTEIEFIAAFAEPLPMAIITQMLGFPLSDLPQLKAWSTAWVQPYTNPLSKEQEIWVAKEGVAFQHYIKSFIDARRAAPRDDIVSYLTRAKLAGSRLLEDHEIIHIVDHLYIGGNETTTFSLASGLWLMLREQGVYQRLLAEPAKIRHFVEETLRLESPTQGLYRMAMEDSEIAGVTVPKGTLLHLRFAAANRDPAVFKDPTELDLDRANTMRHMAFSQAEHHCPGAGLSRLEQQIAWERLLIRLEDLQFTTGKNDFKHLPAFVLRALKSVHVSFRRAR